MISEVNKVRETCFFSLSLSLLDGTRPVWKREGEKVIKSAKLPLATGGLRNQEGGGGGWVEEEVVEEEKQQAAPSVCSASGAAFL